MRRKNLTIIGLIITALVVGFLFWNTGAEKVSAQTDFGAAEYNARNEFALTQGGTATVADNDYQPTLVNPAPSGTTSQSGTNFGGYENNFRKPETINLYERGETK